MFNVKISFLNVFFINKITKLFVLNRNRFLQSRGNPGFGFKFKFMFC